MTGCRDDGGANDRFVSYIQLTAPVLAVLFNRLRQDDSITKLSLNIHPDLYSSP